MSNTQTKDRILGSHDNSLSKLISVTDLLSDGTRLLTPASKPLSDPEVAT